MKSKQIFTLTHPTGSERKYKGVNNNSGSHICAGDVGYISGGAASMMAIALEGSTDQEQWQILNIVDSQNIYLCSIAVLGATSPEHAIFVGLSTFNGDLGGVGACQAYDVLEAPAFVLDRLLSNESRARFKSRITDKELYRLHQQLTAHPVVWKGETTLSSHSDVTGLVSDMVRYDPLRLMQEPAPPSVVKSIVMADSEVEQYDSIVSQVARMDALSNRIISAMGSAADKIKPVNVTKTEPFKKHGVVNIAQIFELSDGQSITIVYHNPDATPAKLNPSDLLTSWKFMLNKRDVTAVLQPKSGKDVNIPALAKRMLKIAEANSARFLRNQERKIKAESALTELGLMESEKQQELLDLDQEIAALQLELDQSTAVAQANPEHGTIDGEQQTEADKIIQAHGLIKDENGHVYPKAGPAKMRSTCQRWLSHTGLKGYVPKVIDGGYVLAYLDDPYFQQNGLITIGHPQYSHMVLKATPKLLFDKHNRLFCVVENATSLGGARFETVEMNSRATVSAKVDGKEVFFFSSAMDAYRATRDSLAQFSTESFNDSAMAKMPTADYSTSVLMAEGNLKQPAELVENKVAQAEATRKQQVKADIDSLRDENGKLNPWSDNAVERVQAQSEWSFDEKLANQEQYLRWLKTNAKLPTEGAEFDAEVVKRRTQIIKDTAGNSSSPDYLKANGLYHTALKAQLESESVQQDESAYQVALEKLAKVESILKENGIAVEETPKATLETRYKIKSTNPRARKPAGSVKIKKLGDGDAYDVTLSLDSIGSGYASTLNGVKSWLAHRLQTFGNAVKGVGDSWEVAKARLELIEGDDLLGLNDTAPEVVQGEPAFTDSKEHYRARRAAIVSQAREARALMASFTDEQFMAASNALFAGLPIEDIRSKLEFQIGGTPELRQKAIDKLNMLLEWQEEQQAIKEQQTIEDPLPADGAEDPLPAENIGAEPVADNKDELWLDQLISGEADLAGLDMDEFSAVAEKYAEDTTSPIYAKLEQALNLIMTAKMEKAKSVKG